MLRGNEFFYEQEDTPQFMVQTSAFQVIRDPKVFTASTISPQNPAPPPDSDMKVVLRVSICCSSCVDLMAADFRTVTGIKKVDYDIVCYKVTVTGTAVLADVLTAARRHFKDAELWD